MGSTINDKCCRFTIVDNPNDKWMNHTIISTTYIYERDSMYTIIVWGYACCRNGKLITQCIYIYHINIYVNYYWHYYYSSYSYYYYYSMICLMENMYREPL